MSLALPPKLYSNTVFDSKYNKSGRTYLFDIDFHHLKDGSPSWENSFTVDAYHAGNVGSIVTQLKLLKLIFFFALLCV
jgi:hypothetical protein